MQVGRAHSAVRIGPSWSFEVFPVNRGRRTTPLPYFGSAMSRNQRIALVVAALAVAVVAFVIARPGDDDDGQERAAQTTPAETRSETTREQEQRQTEAEA